VNTVSGLTIIESESVRNM